MATEGAQRDDLYRVLGLEPRATRAQIERAYRFHLGMYGSDALVASTLLDPAEAERQQRRVREAYDVLSDPDRRRAYDERQGLQASDVEPAALTASTTAPAAATATPDADAPVRSARRTEDGDAPVTFAQPVPALAAVSEPRSASLLAPDSPAFEAFRVLRTKVHTIDAERPARCLGVVSATPREGVSAVAVGLAAALAQEPRSVLLVECRLRSRAALGPALGLEVEPGLGDWLAGPATAPVPLRRVEPWGFDLLAGGTPSARPSDLPESHRLRRLIDAARTSFDFVLVDCPPLEAAADAAVLQEALDGFLLVVRARHAARQALRQALTRLAPDAVRGVVLNDRTEILSRWLDRRRPRHAS